MTQHKITWKLGYEVHFPIRNSHTKLLNNKIKLNYVCAKQSQIPPNSVKERVHYQKFMVSRSPTPLVYHVLFTWIYSPPPYPILPPIPKSWRWPAIWTVHVYWSCSYFRENILPDSCIGNLPIETEYVAYDSNRMYVSSTCFNSTIRNRHPAPKMHKLAHS